jgi:hypothetical protein
MATAASAHFCRGLFAPVGGRVDKADEYRNYAGECRVLAHMLKIEESRRQQLLKVAAAWEALAAEHERRFWYASLGSSLQRAASRFFFFRTARS